MVILRFVHLFSVALWIGMILFFTFFAAPSIFKVLPREVAGDVVGDIFPKYYLIGYITSVLALGSLVAISLLEEHMAWVRIALLVVMTLTTFYSGLVVGREAMAVKADMRAAASADDDVRAAELRKAFRSVHARSAILNVIVIALGVVLLFFMAKEMSFFMGQGPISGPRIGG